MTVEPTTITMPAAGHDAASLRDASHGARLARSWQRLSTVPGGKWVFSRMITRLVPYSATIRPLVLELEPGRVLVAMQDRRAVRNHLRSVHAIALANLGELASALAMLLALPPRVRGIPVSIEIDYLHKARGELIAEGLAAVPHVTGPTETVVHADIRNTDGDIVCSLRVRWKLERV